MAERRTQPTGVPPGFLGRLLGSDKVGAVRAAILGRMGGGAGASGLGAAASAPSGDPPIEAPGKHQADPARQAAPTAPLGTPPAAGGDRARQAEAWASNAIIARLRAAELAKAAAAGPTPAAEAPSVTPTTGSGPAKAGASRPRARSSDLVARMSALLDPARLRDEHPAVIAMILRGQDSAQRSAVLRALPGAQARAVIRHLRGEAPGGSGKRVSPGRRPKR